MRIHRFLAIFSFLFIALGGWALAQGENLNPDILHYDFQIAISDSNDIIRGKAGIQMNLRQNTDVVKLDLVAAVGAGKGMKVSAIQEEKLGNLAFSHTGEMLEIKLGKMMDAGTELKMTVNYAGIPADGLIISKNERDGRSFFGDNWPNRAHHWLPTIDHPLEKATVDFIVLAPAHYEIVANGTLVDQRVERNGFQISHWHNAEPLPTKVMVFGAADFAMQNVGDVNGIPVSTWVFEKDETNGFKDYAQGKAILEWYVKQVGAYPWDKLANVQSRTRYGGMENASCIFYADNSVTGDGSCEALMAHEIAHQWFGNSASEQEWHHIWLSEGFATYFTHVYFEQTHGEQAFLKRMAIDRRDIVGSPVAAQFAVVDTRIQDLNQLLNINSYQKGGWVLHMLRHKLGDDLFFKGIREYYARYKFSNALSEDLQKIMETQSGQDLGPFFKQWLYRPAFPQIDVVWSWKKSKKEVALTITQVGEPYDFPLEIAVLGEDGKQLGTLTQAMHNKVQKATLTVAEMPKNIVLDPQVKLLFEGKVREK
jgi:aminopeptidase N